jgi:RHS repeat-associated protein
MTCYFTADVTRTYRYDAFGNDIGTTQSGGSGSTDSNPFRFKGALGYYWDVETGTYYMMFRSMNPRTGRFSQEDPIRDGLNWYIYSNNNPIFYSDPTGLFAWNERDDQWISVGRWNTERHGGTFSEVWYTRPGASFREATISIWGVEVTFRAGNEGVSTTWGWQVRADVFYQAIVGAAGGEMVFLSAHPAFGGHAPAGNVHTMTVMFAFESSDGYKNNQASFDQNEARWGGVRFATIGGTGSGIMLRGTDRSTTDQNLSTKVFMQHLHSGTGKVDELFTAFNNYNRNKPNILYLGATSNSNSYNRGLLQAVALRPTLPSGTTAWGWGSPVATRHFR